MSLPQCKQRTGFSLVEMIVVIVIGALLFGITSVLLVGILRASAGTTKVVARQQTLLRLAQAWRDDVHGNSKIDLLETPFGNANPWSLVRLGNVEYLTSPGEIVRTVLRDGEAIARERYQLRDGESVSFIVDYNAGIATLCLQQHDEGSPAVKEGNTFEIDAAIGLDLRYQKADE